MKSGQTTRQDLTRAEPAGDSIPANRAAGASASAARRDSRAALPGHSAGWRLPSGQLLVEYALQTCFTGSPFDRSPFQSGTEQGVDTPEGASAGNEAKVAQGLGRLQAAIDREDSTAPVPATRRAPTARPDSSSAKSTAGKERARS